MTAPARRGAQRAGLAVLALAALALMAPVGPGARPRSASRGGGAAKTITVVNVKDLDDGRQYSSIVDRQRPALDRVDGTLRSGETEARVAAFLEAGELRLIDERTRYGEAGGTARNRYYVHGNRLVFFDSVRVRPRDVGKDRLPARDEVVIELAFGDDGRIVGTEKTVNRQPVELPAADESGIRNRFASLANAVAAAGKPAPPP